MNRVAAPPARSNNTPDVGPEPAEQGMSFFGVRLSRIIAIPFRRWKVAAPLLLLCVGLGVAYGLRFAKTTYVFRGTLVYNKPPALPEVREPHDIETTIGLLKSSSEYYDEL
ncbi:MAG TPA: hypothetical protein VEL76_02050, partial [Gemmataceae bacterium]|nr:hypothetical protein [Gemmataceae bacterium]